MFIRSRFLVSPELLQQVDPAGGGGGGAAPGDTGSTSFTKEQQEAIGRAISEERKKIEDRVKSEFEQKQRDLEVQAAQEKADAKAKAEGDFATLEQNLKDQLQKAKDEAKEARDSLKRYQDAIGLALEPAVKSVPEKVMNLYSGPEDDALARWEFIHKPATQELVKEFAGGGEPGPGNGAGPQSGQDPAALTTAQELAIQRTRRSSF